MGCPDVNMNAASALPSVCLQIIDQKRPTLIMNGSSTMLLSKALRRRGGGSSAVKSDLTQVPTHLHTELAYLLSIQHNVYILSRSASLAVPPRCVCQQVVEELTCGPAVKTKGGQGRHSGSGVCSAVAQKVSSHRLWQPWP